MTRVRGVDLAVRDVGTGPPLVWGHGLLGSMAQEDATDLFGGSLLGTGRRLVRYDARGHGASEATLEPGDYRWPELARDMLALMDALDIQQAVLGGVSMGCATSLHAAVAEPRRVAGLLLVAPPTAWSTRRRQARAYRVLAAVVECLGLALLCRLASLPRPPPRNAALADLQRSVAQGLRRADRRAVAAVLRGAAASDLPAPRALAALEAPALILAWTHDPTHPLTTAERLARTLPCADLHVADTPDAMRGWTDHVAGFLGSLEAA